MKYMLIIASVVALAFASPANRALVDPGAAGPAPAPEPEPIAVGPAILDFVPIAVGPTPVDYEPVAVGPTPVFPEEGVSIPVAPAPVPVAPVVQIILNINAAGQVSSPGVVPPAVPVAPAPGQSVNVVDHPPVPIDNGVPVVVPQPIEIGVPVIPSPEVVPEPVVIGTPVLPSPAVVLPEELN